MKRIIMLAGFNVIDKSSYIKKLHLCGNIKVVSSYEIEIELNRNENDIYDNMINKTNEYLKENEDVTIILESSLVNDQVRNYFIDHLRGYETLELHLLKTHGLENDAKHNQDDIYPSEEYIDQYSFIKEVYID